MQQLSRITFNPEVMGGKPCIRGLRVTVGTIVGLTALLSLQTISTVGQLKQMSNSSKKLVSWILIGGPKLSADFSPFLNAIAPGYDRLPYRS